MDGLLLDTETISRDTFIQACAEYNYRPDLTAYYTCIGTNTARVKQILSDGYGRDIPFEAVYRLWKDMYNRIVVNEPVPLKSGALELLQRLASGDTKTAVVTSTERALALRKLANAGIDRFFDFVLGGDQVARSKPEPDMYLTAVSSLSEVPADCLALEDSDNGVLSACRAGLTVIQVVDLVQPSEEVRALGHRIVKSLDEVTELLGL